ncbi:MAG: aminotransferase class IV, partial [Desulfofustis sp.]
GRFFTPPLDCGVLPGVMRKELMQANGSLNLDERVLFPEDLQQAERLYICNSVRGVLPVILET